MKNKIPKILTDLTYYIAYLVLLTTISVIIIWALTNGELLANNEVAVSSLNALIRFIFVMLSITVIGFLDLKRSKKYLKSFFSALLKLM